jgi:EAL domain-containing protein (putative c-di-GMP-specific phosphodiesterase class I)
MNDWLKLNTSIRQAIDPLQLMQRVADQALALVEGADGVLVGLMVDTDHLRTVCAAGTLTGCVGELLMLAGSLAGEAVRAGEVLIADDTEADARVNPAAARADGVRSSICVPLVRSGDGLGVLTVSSSRPRAFQQNDVLLVSGLAEFVGAVVGASLEFTATSAKLFASQQTQPFDPDSGDPVLSDRFVENVLEPSAPGELAMRARIERILEYHDFSLVFQPILELDGGGLFCTEALVRFGEESADRPDVLIAQAHRVGLGVQLEVAIIKTAVAQLDRLPGWGLLAVNAAPSALASDGVAEALARSDPERLIVELTEHVRVDDYPQLTGAVRTLRQSGVRLAVHDAGAGFASLMHILKLAPDFIKLDRVLVSGIDSDPVRGSLVESLLRFADETGARIIAECIETPAELAALRDMGVRFGQGYYLVRPGPISAIREAIRAGSARIHAQRDEGRARHMESASATSRVLSANSPT